MKIKITVNNFFERSKQNWKEIILWGIIIWILTSLLLNPLIKLGWSMYGPQPSIVANVVIAKDANIPYNCTSPTKFQNFFLLYYLREKWSTLFIMDSSDKNKMDEWGIVNMPTFSICSDCSVYSFRIKNIGNRKAEKLVIEFNSPILPEIINEDPRMIQGKCGGVFGETSCRLTFEDIYKDAEISFAILTRENSDLFVSSCIADDKYHCEFKFVDMLAHSFNVYKEGLMMDGRKIIFPTLENSEPNIIYVFDPNGSDEEKSSWTFYK